MKPPATQSTRSSHDYLTVIHHHLETAYLLDEAKIAEVLPRFLETLWQHLENFRAPLLDQDLAALSKASHTLKGALLNLGLSDLADIAYTMEQEAKNGHAVTDLAALAEYLRREISSFAGPASADYSESSLTSRKPKNRAA